MVKLKIHIYANACIFSLTTSGSRKLIFKADLKWEGPYFYSKIFFGAFRSVLKKVKKWIFHCIFKMWFGRGGYIFSSKIFSENAKHLRMCPSTGGNVGETWSLRGPFISPPTYGQFVLLCSAFCSLFWFVIIYTALFCFAL